MFNSIRGLAQGRVVAHQCHPGGYDLVCDDQRDHRYRATLLRKQTLPRCQYRRGASDHSDQIGRLLAKSRRRVNFESAFLQRARAEEVLKSDWTPISRSRFAARPNSGVRRYTEKFSRPELRTAWASVVDGGMRLEVSATIDGLERQLVTTLADEQDEALWVQVYVGSIAVQVPASLLRKVLDDAVGEVHSENWYDRNKPPGHDA